MARELLNVVKLLDTLDTKVLVLAKRFDAFLAGGSVIATLKNRPIADYDFFFRNEEDYREFYKGMVTNFPSRISIGNRITRTDFADTFTTNDLKVYQLVTKRFDEPENILQDFDLAICKVGYDFKDAKWVYDDSFIDDFQSGTLRIVNTKHLISVIMRVVKYMTKYGFNIRQEDVLKLTILFSNINFKEATALYDTPDSAMKTHYYAQILFEDVKDIPHPSSRLEFYQFLLKNLARLAI